MRARFRRIELKAGHQIVPDGLELINPERMGECLYVYGVWAFPAQDDGKTFIVMNMADAFMGACIGHPLGWLSNYPDLHIIHSDQRTVVDDDQWPAWHAREAEVDALLDGAVAILHDDLHRADASAIAWALVDSFSNRPTEHSHMALAPSQR